MPAPISTNQGRIPFLAWAALPVLVAAGLRCHNLGRLEPFIDEGANILTALDPRVQAIFEPIEQGRPLLIWLFSPAGWWPAQALLIARMMTAYAGLITMGAMGWALYWHGGRRPALWGLWLWAVLPLAVWHERLALQDPFVTAALACALAMVAAGSRAGSKTGQGYYVGAGIFFGTAFLLKISALFALPWLALWHYALQRQAGRPVLDRRLAFLSAGIIITLLPLGSHLRKLGAGLGHYHALPAFGGDSAVAAALVRFKIWLGWYLGYGGWPLLLLITIGLLFAILWGRVRRTVWYCFSGWVLSLLIGGLCYNNGFARYSLPDYLPLIIFLSLSLGSTPVPGWPRALLGVAIVAIVRWASISWQASVDPAEAAIPASEIAVYASGVSSGKGVTELRRYLTDYADRQHVQCLVLTHRFHRPGCYGLMLAELSDPRIVVVPFTIDTPQELVAAMQELRANTKGHPVDFFVLFEGSLYPAPAWVSRSDAGMGSVHTVNRDYGETFSLYQVTR